MLCSAFIQPHSDYTYLAWYPNQTKNTQKNENTIYAKKEYLRFCLTVDKTHHIFLTEFRPKNCLPTKERIHQCINVI